MPEVPNSSPATACPLSVVMPAYNEEESIAEAVDEVRTHVLDLVRGSELWVVDDGSRDHTPAILAELATIEPRLHVLNKTNGGHGAALIAGLAQARGDWMLLVDSDRQIPLDAFSAAWDRRRGFDALFGERKNRRDPLVRKLVTAALKLQVRLLFRTRLADPNAPFKLVSRNLWNGARKVIPPDCLIPSVFLAVYAHRAGSRWAGVAVAYRARSAGQTSLSKLKLARFSARSLGQLLAFKMAHVDRRAAVDLGRLVGPEAKEL